MESTAKNAKDVVPDQYVRGYLYVPEDYTGDEEVPLVVTISGNGTSFWILEDGTNNFGTNIMYDAATTSWIGKAPLWWGSMTARLWAATARTMTIFWTM